MSTTTFDRWVQAPFLQQLNGRQLFDLLQSIHRGHYSGVAECALEDGRVSVLRFDDGTPLAERDEVSRLVGRDSVVVAWMPGRSEARSGEDTLSRERTERNRDLAELVRQTVTRDLPDLDDKGWIAFLDRDELLAAAGGQVGLRSVTGLVAQVNGVFGDVLRDRPLSRFNLDFHGERFGFQRIDGERSLLYRKPRSVEQKRFQQTLNELRETLLQSSGGANEYDLRSNASVRRETSYAMLRPQLYRRIDRAIRARFAEFGTEWDHIWFQRQPRVVYSMPRDGHSQQEIDSSLAQLLGLVRQGFEPLVGTPAANLVLHAPGATIWCDFFAQGFWATRFDQEGVVFRSVAEEVAQGGWFIVEQLFDAG